MYAILYEYRCRIIFFSSHSVTDDMSVAESARAAEFFLSDGVIITGTETGVAPNRSHITGQRGRPNNTTAICYLYSFILQMLKKLSIFQCWLVLVSQLVILTNSLMLLL